MKTLILVVLVVVNVICIFTITKMSKEVRASVQNYGEQADKKFKKLDEFFSDIDVIKGAVGWKTTEGNPTVCMKPEKMLEGPFSFYSFGKDDKTKCYFHEFTKLNEFVKQAGMYFLDDKFGSFLHTLERFEMPVDDLKVDVKKIIEKLQ